jgi:hypothetical protein
LGARMMRPACRRAYVGMSDKGNGGTYHYYACSGRQKLGRKSCDSLEAADDARLRAMECEWWGVGVELVMRSRRAAKSSRFSVAI